MTRIIQILLLACLASCLQSAMRREVYTQTTSPGQKYTAIVTNRDGGATTSRVTALEIGILTSAGENAEIQPYFYVSARAYIDVHWIDDSHLLAKIVTREKRENVFGRNMSAPSDVNIDVQWITDFEDVVKSSEMSRFDDLAVSVIQRQYRGSLEEPIEYLTYVCVRIGSPARAPEDCNWVFVAKGRLDLDAKWTTAGNLEISTESLKSEDVFLRRDMLDSDLSISYTVNI